MAGASVTQSGATASEDGGATGSVPAGVTASKPSLRVTLLRQAAQYSIGTFLSMFAAIARAGIGARYLSPAQVGSWLALQVLVGYASNLHCGTVFGMFRSVPMLLARGDKMGAHEEQRTSFSFIVLVSVVGSCAGLIAGPKLFPTVGFAYLLEAIILALTTLLKSWYVGVFKAERRFAELSASSGAGALVAMLGVAAIPVFGLNGLLGGMIGQNVFEMLVLGTWKGLPAFGLSKPVLVSQLRVGILTLLTNLGVMAITTVERTVMLQLLGIAATGVFVLGAQVAYLIPVIAAVPAGVLTPHLFERVGRGENLMPLVEKPIMLMSYVFSWLIAAGIVAMAPTVALVWPNLMDGNLAAKLALVGTLPMVLVGPISNVYYAVDRQGPHVVILLSAALVTYVIAVAGAHLTGTIAGAAGGATVGLFVYYVAALFGAFRMVQARWTDALRFAGRSLLPMVYAGAVVAACECLLSGFFPERSPVRALLAEVILLGAMAPWLRVGFALVRGRG